MKEQYQHTEFTIGVLEESDLEDATKMRLQSWLDTYVNNEYGVTAEWIAARNADQLTSKIMQARKERLHDPNVAGFVAKDNDHNVIGAAMVWRDEVSGEQHLGSLYVDKSWHGKGVAAALMGELLEWFDTRRPIVLDVVSYNERAKAFYRKWGFIEMPGSEQMFEEMIPEITMIRKGDES